MVNIKHYWIDTPTGTIAYNRQWLSTPINEANDMWDYNSVICCDVTPLMILFYRYMVGLK